MNRTSGDAVSYWIDTAKQPSFQPLSSNEQSDVCVIGGGIAGLTTAYLLARSGVNVILLDDGELASGETGRTTAHITNVIDDRYFEMVRLHGEEGARLAADSHTQAINQIEQIVKEENIDCAFTRLPGYLYFLSDQSNEVDKEIEGCKTAGIQFNEVTNPTNIPKLTDGRVLHFPNQAQFHATRYTAQLANAAVHRGARIFTGTHAEKIHREKDQVEVEVTKGHKVRCKDVVVATNIPISNLVLIHIKQSAYRSFVIAGRVPKGSVPLGLYWDNLEPYHYVRIQPEAEHDVLIVGGEDHKTGQEDDANERYAKLEAWTRERFPQLGDITHRWSGQVVEPIDGLGYVGLEPEKRDHVYIITGDSGMGMTHGTLGAMLVRDMILGRENPWEKIYDTGRINLKAAGELLREDANMAAQYVDHVTPGDVDSVDEIPNGEGRLVRKGLRKLAVYKDESGNVHAMSSLCTHLGCVVQWNSGEKSWDCPCHGSRFDPYGKVLNGPAIKELKKVDLDKDN